MHVTIRISGAVAIAALLTFGLAAQQAPPTPSLHAKAAKRLIIKNAMVIYGNAKPPYGPVDIVVQDGLISYIGSTSESAANSERSSDAVIDAAGKYVMPGIVNAHMHWHEERQPGIAQPIQYERNLYLAAGVTTAREVGGDFDKSKRWQAESNAHTIISPRILVYPFVSKGRTGSPAEIRAWIRDIKQKGADGLKIIGMDRDQLEAIMDEAHKLGLRTATHIAVEETTAKDYAELGVNSIEHFYGVADAALNGIQNFPPETSYSNEVHRFGRAGELYAQADPAKLSKIDRPDGRKARRLGSDLLDLRSQPRPGPRAEPAVVPGLPASVDGGILQGLARQPRLVLPRLDLDAGSALEAAVPDLDGRGPRVRPQGRPGHHRRRRRLHLLDVRLRHLARAGAARGGRVPAARSHRARDLERREAARHGGPAGQGPRRLHRRPRHRQRQPDREPEAPEPERRRRDAAQRPAGVELFAARTERSRPAGARRRHRVDDQGRHPVSRADADARGEGDGRARRASAPRRPTPDRDRDTRSKALLCDLRVSAVKRMAPEPRRHRGHRAPRRAA